MAFDPINYATDVQTPFAAAAQGYQLGAGIRDDQIKQAQQAQAMRQQHVQQQALQDLISNPSPTAQDYARATMLIPGMREQFDQAHKMMSAEQQRADLSHVSQVYAALSQDQPEVATKLLSDRAEALRNSGRKDEAAHLDTISQLTTQAPALARSMAGLYLASVPGGDKVIEGAKGLGAEQRANDLQPGLVRQGNAAATSAEAKALNAPRAEAAAADEAVSKATKAGAEANNAPVYYAAQAAEAGSKAKTAAVTATNAPENARLDLQNKGLQGQNLRSEIADRTKRFGLEADKFQSELKLKLMELQNKLGELPEPVAKEVNSATTDAIAAQNSAAKMTDLAQQIEKASADMGGGVTAKAGELWKKTFGTQNDLTRIRAEYARIVTPAAMGAYKQVASGSTSDKDIETAMLGVPKDTDSPERMASFLRGAAKLQAYDAVLKNAQAEWQGAVHSLGKAKTDISIDGVKVPAGTTFKQFADQYVQSKAAKLQAATTVQTRGYMRFAQPDASAPGALGSGTYGAQ